MGRRKEKVGLGVCIYVFMYIYVYMGAAFWKFLDAPRCQCPTFMHTPTTKPTRMTKRIAVQKAS